MAHELDMLAEPVCDKSSINGEILLEKRLYSFIVRVVGTVWAAAPVSDERVPLHLDKGRFVGADQPEAGHRKELIRCGDGLTDGRGLGACRELGNYGGPVKTDVLRLKLED